MAHRKAGLRWAGLSDGGARASWQDRMFIVYSGRKREAGLLQSNKEAGL